MNIFLPNDESKITNIQKKLISYDHKWGEKTKKNSFMTVMLHTIICHIRKCHIVTKVEVPINCHIRGQKRTQNSSHISTI